MYICLCLGVTTSTVQHAIDAGARSTKQVAEACGAGSICGRCGHTIRTMIEAAAPDPSASKLIEPGKVPNPVVAGPIPDVVASAPSAGDAEAMHRARERRAVADRQD